MKIIGYVIYWIIQWTWGFPQTIIGLVYTLMHKGCKHTLYHGACTTYHNGEWGGISLGMFTLVNGNRHPDWVKSATVHEYGHTIQSLIFGPLYLIVIGLPSIIWCNCKRFIKMREEGKCTYYDFYPESGANFLGALFTGEPKPTADVLKLARSDQQQ